MRPTLGSGPLLLASALIVAVVVSYQSALAGWQSGAAYASLNRVLTSPDARLRVESFVPSAPPPTALATQISVAEARFEAGGPRLSYGRGLLDLIKDEAAAARDDFQQTAGRAPDAGFQLGLAQYRDGNPTQAGLEWAGSATEPLVWARAHAALAAARRVEAAGVLQLLAQMHPDDARSWLDLAEVAVNQQDWPSALQALQHVLGLEPANLDAQYLIGYCLYYGNGDTTGARQALQTIVSSNAATDPQRANAYVLLARMSVAAGRPQEGLDWYARAAALSGALPLFPLREMAAVYVTQGDSQQAIDALRQALRYAPSDPQALLQLGQVLVDTGQTDAGISYLRQAAAAAPDDPAPRAALAKALAR